MANITRAFVTDQEVLLTDEQTGGLVSSAISKVQKALEGMAEEGVSVLLVEEGCENSVGVR
jgi:ABC-type branched-subunit amino acid transport system ATPase component